MTNHDPYAFRFKVFASNCRIMPYTDGGVRLLEGIVCDEASHATSHQDLPQQNRPQGSCMPVLPTSGKAAALPVPQPLRPPGYLPQTPDIDIGLARPRRIMNSLGLEPARPPYGPPPATPPPRPLPRPLSQRQDRPPPASGIVEVSEMRPANILHRPKGNHFVIQRSFFILLLLLVMLTSILL